MSEAAISASPPVASSSRIASSLPTPRFVILSIRASLYFDVVGAGVAGATVAAGAEPILLPDPGKVFVVGAVELVAAVEVDVDAAIASDSRGTALPSL